MAESKSKPDRVARVDCHAHIFHKGMGFTETAHSRPDYEYRIEDWLADMEQHGLTHGVISAATLYGENSDYTLETLAAHSNIRATVILSPDTAADRLKDWADRGVVGIRLVWRHLPKEPDFSAEPWKSFLGRLADVGMHIELLASGEKLAELVPAISSNGPLVVVDHFGAPPRDADGAQETAAILLKLIEDWHCRVKLSAGFRMPFESAQIVASRLIEEAGPQWLLWGSDAPFVTHEKEIDYDKALALYSQLVPDPSVREAIDRAALDLFFAGEG